ncbi:MAG: hypothetical protein ABIH85_04405 [Candidatus Omnitrophota bacterium]
MMAHLYKHIRNMSIIIALLMIDLLFLGDTYAGVSMDGETIAISMPLGANLEESVQDLCPEGINVLGMFMALWSQSNYEGMYELIDDESKENYSFEQAKLDFQFMKFKNYTISLIKKQDENFEFFLTHGDWKSGDKDLRKILLSGKTFKIIMLNRGEFLKKSVDCYF